MSRRWARLVLAVLGLTGAVAPGAASPARAAELGGFSLRAQADVVSLLYDNPDLPLLTHPVVEARVPHTTATLDTGPIGYALSSIAWPGPMVANLGTASQQLDQLCLLPPLPCLPLSTGVKDLLKPLNYPVRAEASFPQGPVDARLVPAPGVEMVSHTSDGESRASAVFSQFASPGLLSVGSLTADSVTTVRNGVAQAQSRGSLSRLELAGGLVTIDSVTSTAKASTDGSKASADGETVVGGVRLAGQPAVIDDKGVHLGTLPPSPLLAIIDRALNQTLSSLGLTIALQPPRAQRDGPAASFTAGALVVGLRAAGNFVTLTMGGATASASAAVTPEVPVVDPAVRPGPGVPPSPTPPLATPGPPPQPSPDPPASPAPATPAGPGPVEPSPSPIALFSGVPPGVMLGAAAASLALAGWLWRLSTVTLGAGAGGGGPRGAGTCVGPRRPLR